MLTQISTTTTVRTCALPTNALKSFTEGVKSSCPDESAEADEMVMKTSPKTKHLKITPA